MLCQRAVLVTGAMPRTYVLLPRRRCVRGLLDLACCKLAVWLLPNDEEAPIEQADIPDGLHERGDGALGDVEQLQGCRV